MRARQVRRGADVRGATAWIVAALLLAGCATAPPRQPADVCAIFDEKDDWYRAARAAEVRWQSPVPVLMAFMHQESGFVHDAKPPRRKLLWFIPWTRPSSAYGYAQATNEAWSDYVDATGGLFADRDDFADAVDFIGWYNSVSVQQLGLAPDDVYALYLAYHEGRGGYARGTFTDKAWLQATALRVAMRADDYARQRAQCADRLEAGGGSWWWPF